HLVAEAVLVGVHPAQQPACGLLWPSAGGLAGRDPAADQGLGERAEAAAGVVDLLGLLVASGQEGLVQRGRPDGLAGDEPADARRDLFEAVNESEASSVGHEPPRLEGVFDLRFHRVRTLASRVAHRRLCGERLAAGWTLSGTAWKP